MSWVARIESLVFKWRRAILAGLGLLTAGMAVLALQLHMEAGYEKQIPTSHPYIVAFQKYRADLFGANRLTVVVKPRKGDIWTPQALGRLHAVTGAVMALPNVSKLGVQSLWTPNSFVNEITEEGFRAEPLIPGTVTPTQLNKDNIAAIQRATAQGNFLGVLVARDQSSAMVTAEIEEVDAQGHRIDYVAYNRLLEERIRKPFEDADIEILIIGFAKQIGDIADGARSVTLFCAIALLLTVAALYWYCHSWRLTLLPVVCSLASLIWQFGTLRLLGFGLDPLGVLVPFLVFAIGVSHGVQQINYIVREISHGKTTEEASRSSFSGLLIPGTLALATAFVSFITLVLIPIPMVLELAVTASIGVAYKIITNLLMLPIAASLLTFTKEFADKAMNKREQRAHALHVLARVAEPRTAAIVLLAASALFATAVWQSRDRIVGTLQPGAPELRPDSRFNRDAATIAATYDVGLDWLTVMFEAPADSCNQVAIGRYQDRFVAAMRPVEGVLSISSFSEQIRTFNEGYNEGNPRMFVVPSDPANYGGLAVEVGRSRGYMRKDCSMLAVHLFLTDHKAKTIQHVVDEIKRFGAEHPQKEVKILLAAGNAGVLAAVDEELEHSELPMMLYVYAAIVVLVGAVYRDWRAVVACCVPLTVGTFVGYWFMKELQIGLTVATLPAMVLAVGIGVDYAFYIYNRLQLHLAHGRSIEKAIAQSLHEVGIATIFTAITLAIGVATWSFSDLKFQADMGKLLAFMFVVNLVMAMTVLPALAVWLDRLVPRRGPVYAPGLLDH